ncbi:type I-E CRISPR-associated protein Cas6/Cse3/CasE [Lentzea sp. NPDC042327]|uniref:type I-E CRISPR-associated protein Cas6/Cse3/CasE n=1 Tax=Lentzea sp. NPDC042327 TaxID=3154801 RepID=UPI0033C4B1F4
MATAVFVLITLFVVIRASRNTKTAADYLAAGRAFTGPQNGIAIAGDYLSAASFEGRLEITDPDALRHSLTHGIGHGKAYGCGLLTLAPVKRA